jgi:NAD(P)-dependent dehydrogenase (short-subunit alcohol dehydrogenase family)
MDHKYQTEELGEPDLQVADLQRDLEEEEGRKCIAVAGDIQQEAHCQQLVERARSEFGKLDILVNNAAFQMTRESIENGKNRTRLLGFLPCESEFRSIQSKCDLSNAVA